MRVFGLKHLGCAGWNCRFDNHHFITFNARKSLTDNRNIATPVEIGGSGHRRKNYRSFIYIIKIY